MINRTHFPTILKAVTFSILTAFLFLLSLPSCFKCETLEQIITPSTSLCLGNFYLNQAENFSEVRFSLHDLVKPIPEPFKSDALEGPLNIPAALQSIRSNYSAYDSLNQRYVYEYAFNAGGVPRIYLYQHHVPSKSSSFSTPMNSYVSPVFLNGKMYAIKVFESSSGQFFEVVEVNPLNGQELQTIINQKITVNSSLLPENMSVCTNGKDRIYFLSGTNVIEVQPNTKTAVYTDIDPLFNPRTRNVLYFGLEYQLSSQRLLAMRNTFAQTGTLSEVVAINLGASSPVSPVFDLSAALSEAVGKVINLDYYSSTFDPCGDTYYLTTLKTDGAARNTNLISLALPQNKLQVNTLDRYWYGIEYRAQ